MDAWILDQSPGEYRFGSIDLADPGPGEVRVRPVTSALNHMDLWLTRGLPKPALPHVPGCDVAGTVEAVGAGVELDAGTEVVVNPAVAPLDAVVSLGVDSPLGRGFQILGEQRWGGHGDGVVVPARNVVAKPSSRSWQECAAFPLATLTAYRMLRRARLSAGETVLVVGIGGGVSMAALSLAQAMGAVVYVTSRQQSKIDQAVALGAVAGFDSTDERWPVRADVVVESVGPATWDASVRSLVPGGRLVVCGGTSGQKVEVDLPKLFFKQIEIIGSTMGSYEEFASVLRLVDQGLPIAVDEVFDRADYPAALERLRSGDQLGKVVLVHPV
ncbi:MAG: zinc-binding dehydrogenase [Acidimicrobiales bacterium]